MNTLEFLYEYYGKLLGIESCGDSAKDAIRIMTGSNYSNSKGSKVVLKTGKLIIRKSGVLSSTEMNIEGIKTVPLKKDDPDWIWNGEPAIYIFLSKKTFNYQNLAITYDPRHVCIAMSKGLKIENWSNKT